MLLLIAMAGMVLPGTNISYSNAKEEKYLIVPNPIPVQSQQENHSISTNMKWKTSGIFSYEITNEEKKEVTLRRMNTINQIVEIPEKIDNYTVVGVGEMYEEKCIVSENEVRVVANYRETQMKHIQVGNKVEIEADAIPDMVYQGEVEAISGGTGSAFSQIPVDNATGNFVKVEQRVPVRIRLSADNKPEDVARLLAGLNVETEAKY